MKNYEHVIKNKMLPSGKLISDYEIMTGKNISDEEFAYIDEIGILPMAPKDQWIIPEGFIVDLDGQVKKRSIKLWKTNLKNVNIIENRCVLACQE